MRFHTFAMQLEVGISVEGQHHIRDASVHECHHVSSDHCIRLPSPLMLRHFPTCHLMISECTCKLHKLAHAVQMTTQHH